MSYALNINKLYTYSSKWLQLDWRKMSKIILVYDLQLAYSCAFSEDVKECSNFQNECFDANELKLKGDDGLGLAGTVNVKMPIEAGYEVTLS